MVTDDFITWGDKQEGWYFADIYSDRVVKVKRFDPRKQIRNGETVTIYQIVDFYDKEATGLYSACEDELFMTKEAAEEYLKKELANMYSDETIAEKITELKEKIKWYESLKDYRNNKYLLHNFNGDKRYIYYYSFEEAIEKAQRIRQKNEHEPDVSNLYDLDVIFKEYGSFQKLLDEGLNSDNGWDGYYDEETDYEPNFNLVACGGFDGVPLLCGIDVYDVSDLDFDNLTDEESNMLYDIECQNLLIKYNDKTYLLIIYID